ncbi:uracil-DNA glycosylase [Pelobacter sp. M08fum]|uniref:Type-4 uracil-DNA glycosylase n=1 Tax=Pelovirga terrestris TaxID=2771352 RepID=A0A8J6UNB6_9BACT|nr:uracil-DNA glycosylase [Pelovirga terrestris]
MTDKLYHECYTLVCQARRLLEELEELGFNPPAPLDTRQNRLIDTVAPAVMPPSVVGETLSDLRSEVELCCACPLHETRKTVVFGRGNPAANLVFVGEAPGHEEDQQGEPFVGEAGRLLERILFAMGLSADDVYICNLIKCRPPANRDPHANEVVACEPYLKRQLALLKPTIIVTLGRFAAQTLLGVQTPVSRLRGQWHSYEGVALMPTFHPAYLLRSPQEKKQVWEDMTKVKQRLGLVSVTPTD